MVNKLFSLIIFLKTEKNEGALLAVQLLGLGTFTAAAPVQSMVKELLYKLQNSQKEKKKVLGGCNMGYQDLIFKMRMSSLTVLN